MDGNRRREERISCGALKVSPRGAERVTGALMRPIMRQALCSSAPVTHGDGSMLARQQAFPFTQKKIRNTSTP